MVLLHPSDCHQEGQRSPEALNMSLKSLFMLVTFQSTSPSSQTWRSQGINVFILTKRRTWSGRAHLVITWEAKAHAGDQMLKGDFWRPRKTSVSTAPQKWSHFKLTLRKHSAYLHDGRHQSLYKGWCWNIIFLAHHGFHKVNPGWCPHVRAHPPSRQAQTLQVFWPPSSSTLLPNPAHDHSLLWAIMMSGLSCFNHKQTHSGSGALRQIHVSKRDLETHPMSWWALLFNHIVTTQDESVNGCVAAFKKKHSAWKKKQPFAEPEMPPQH